jgi:hypothetical protein
MRGLWASLVSGAAILAATPISTPAVGQVAPLVARQRHLTDAEWREDLRVLVAQIQKVHPHPFHHVAQAQFNAAVSDLDAAIPTLSDHEIEVRFARLVALLGEGHSRVSLPGLRDPMSDVPDITPAKDPSLVFHRLPVQLRQFTDGLFVVGAAPQYRSLIGSQVIKIGERSAQSALEAVQPVINRDNDMGVRLIGPDLVAIPEVLRAVGVTGDEALTPMSFRGPDGKLTEMALPASAGQNTERWLHADDAAHLAGSPYVKHAGENVWIDYDPASETLLAGVNVIKDAPGRPVARLAREIDAVAASRPVRRFVIDFRGCHGGDNSKFRALLLTILRNPTINRPGRSFVLIDRATFSAAVNSASDMERLSNAIFVGEPTAGAPSSWGDPRKIALPNSGLIARISSIYWRDWTADESRPWIAPDISVPASSADYFAGKDRVMAQVLSFPQQSGFADVLMNLIRAGAGGDSIQRLYYQRKNDAAWADETTEAAMQGAGAEFLARKAYDDAFVMFVINSRDYPSSFGRSQAAIEAALKADPESEDIKRLAKKLQALKPRA